MVVSRARAPRLRLPPLTAQRGIDDPGAPRHTACVPAKKRTHRIDPATHARTIEQAAAELGVSPQEVQRALEQGRLRGTKTPAGRWRVEPADLAAYREREETK
jgi:excisionase family DNA binding protein